MVEEVDGIALALALVPEEKEEEEENPLAVGSASGGVSEGIGITTVGDVEVVVVGACTLGAVVGGIEAADVMATLVAGTDDPRAAFWSNT